MRALLLPCVVFPLLFSGASSAQTDANQDWQAVVSSDGSTAQARHESGAIEVNGKLYLIGGRAMREVQVYDPVAATWTDLGPTPLEIHHFQPVAIGDLIYLIGSFTCCYPSEEIIADIHVFDTQTNTWSIAGSMPASRVRGSAGSVVYNNKIYVLGGNTQGHAGGAVAWFDEYDPATQQWTVLPDAPNARDHFAAVVIEDFLVAAAGRQTSQPNPFTNPVIKTDMYDFVANQWIAADDIPTARAGALSVAAGDEVIVAGGEINTSTIALNTVEAMNIYTGQWRTLKPMLLGRHSGGGAVLNGRFHVTAGSLNTGGAPETDTVEALVIDDTKTIDFDLDGLSNNDELRLYGTNPARTDTDGDGMIDSVEIQLGFDPLNEDTDGDGILDGDEAIEPVVNPPVGNEPNDNEPEDNEPGQTPVDMSSGEPVEQGTGMVTSSGSVSVMLIAAILVGRLSRLRLRLRQIYVEK